MYVDEYSFQAVWMSMLFWNALKNIFLKETFAHTEFLAHRNKSYHSLFYSQLLSELFFL